MSDRSFLVVGLGNIGPEYATTRHNIGFLVLDAWAQASNTVFVPGRYGDMAVDSFKGRKFHLLKPSTYMTLSGNAVRFWMQELDIPVSNLMIICDDLNLPFGTLRMRPKGSDGGHNGLKNIQELIQTQEYARLRFGVGHEFARGAQIDYVLSQFTDDELALVDERCPLIISGVKEWALAGIQRAMSSINTKQEKKIY